MKRIFVRFVLAAGAGVALLAGCGGGGSGGAGSLIPNQPGSTASPAGSASPPPGSATPSPTPTPVSTPTSGPTATPTPPGPSTQTDVTHFGGLIGQPNSFTPNEGDTPSGGHGMPIDGVTCDPTMSNNYHVHLFLGVFVNGKRVAIPPGLGMENPEAVEPSGVVNAATCFYYLHTHDSSGIVHVEDPTTTLPQTASIFTLKTFFDIWGITVNSAQFGQFSGPVRVFTSGQVYRGDANNGVVPATDLSFYGTDANSVPIYSHEVVFIEIGPTFPTNLPNVKFYTEF